MRGRRIFREPVDPYLAPPWRDPPEPLCDCMPWRCCAICMTADDGRLEAYDRLSENEAP